MPPKPGNVLKFVPRLTDNGSRGTPTGSAIETTDLQRASYQYVSARVAARAIRSSTAVNERRILSYFTAAMGARRPAQLGQADIERWLGSMVNLAPGTVRNRFAIVSRFLGHLVEIGVIRRSPARLIAAPKVPRSRHRALHKEQVALIVAACTDPRDTCIVILGFQLGMRRAELAAIDVGDITWGHRPAILIHGKGGHERVVPLTIEAVRVINAYLAWSPANGGPLVRGDKYPMRGVSPDWIGKVFSRVAYDAGVKVAPRDGVSTHAARHTCATDVHARTGDVMAVQHLLGHQSLATTQVYVAVLDVEKLRGAMEGRTYSGAA